MDGATYPDGEWLELHNTGNVALDLMGWKIMDGIGNVTFIDVNLVNNAPLDTMIEATRRLVQFFMGTDYGIITTTSC